MIIVAAAVILALVIVLSSCGMDLFGPKGNIEKGYELLEKGDLEKADEEINEYICRVSDEDDNAYNVTMYEFIGTVARVKLEIAKGNSDLAASEIKYLFEEIKDENTTVDYDTDAVKELAKWYLTEFCPADDVDDYVDRFTWQVPELEGYIYMGDVEYEETEPYKEYKVLYIGGVSTEIKYYTGGVANVRWKNEGYEAAEPYKEFERKYINGKATDEVRYTGKTKPKVVSKRYTFPTCPICGYSAALSPTDHPGHGLEGLERFERGQNSDGS